MPSGPKHETPRRLSFLLHAHLPYGFSAGSTPSLEQAWLYEAVTHCYLPLLSLIRRLREKQTPWLTVSLSPTLLELWSEPGFADRYQAHLENGLRLVESETKHASHPKERRKLALDIMAQWLDAKEQFERIGGQLPSAFGRQSACGKIELVTTAATHPFLPAFQNDPAFLNFQIENGIETFRRHTGIRPKGFWLPECAYFNGLEDNLARFGIEYFGLEEQGLTRAKPTSSVRQPLTCPNGLRALGRDNRLSQKVWNARYGYPGHPSYREFHHDGIHQVETDRCGHFALPDGGRLPFGLKYWRVSGKPEKEWYKPEQAKAQAKAHAADFVAQIETVSEGLIFLPFDAELFGHWWYEGPLWLEQVLHFADDQADTSIDCAALAARSFGDLPPARPAASTWGRKGDYSFWVNRETDWIYALLQTCSRELEAQIQRQGLPQDRSSNDRVLRQAARELLHASASDWPFMIRAGTTVDYARERIHEHIQRFHFLLGSLRENQPLAPDELARLEQLSPAFEAITVAAYSQAL